MKVVPLFALRIKIRSFWDVTTLLYYDYDDDDDDQVKYLYEIWIFCGGGRESVKCGVMKINEERRKW